MFLYFGGSLSDRKKKTVKIGITSDLKERAKGYATSHSPVDPFNFWFSVVIAEEKQCRQAERHFLYILPTLKKVCDGYCGKEWRAWKQSIDKLRIMVIQELNLLEISFEEHCDTVSVNPSPAKRVISAQDFGYETWNAFQRLAIYRFTQCDFPCRKIIRQPTGTGKLAEVLAMLSFYHEKRETSRILWITCRNDILDTQKTTFDVFTAVTGIVRVEKRKGLRTSIPETGSVLVTTLYQSNQLGSTLEALDNGPYDFVVYDECHDGLGGDFGEKLAKRIDEWNASFLAVSATPDYSKLSALTLCDPSDFLINKTLPEACNLKLVRKPRLEFWTMMNYQELWKKIIEKVTKFGDGWRWIVYLPELANHAREMKECAPLELDVRLHISGRKDIKMHELREKPGTIQIVLACQTLTTGADICSLQGVFIIQEGALGGSLCEQIIGRALRLDSRSDFAEITFVLGNEEAKKKTFENLSRSILRTTEDLFEVVYSGKKTLEELFQEYEETWNLFDTLTEEKLSYQSFISKMFRDVVDPSYKKLCFMVRGKGLKNRSDYLTVRRSQFINWPDNPDSHYKEWKNWWIFFHDDYLWQANDFRERFLRDLLPGDNVCDHYENLDDDNKPSLADICAGCVEGFHGLEALDNLIKTD
jgi:superfamily II DNA or RNA helicase